MGLIHQERGKNFPAKAAILLADYDVRKRFFPYAKIECARFKGTEPGVFIDQLSITEPIFKAAKICMSFIKRNIVLSSTIGEVYRKDTWEYPLDAIREAVNNAIIHRDYSILGSDIKVAVFDDMLEITSPGPLPDVMPMEKLGSGRSEIRNRILAPIFKDLGLIEAWGTGIMKIRKEVKKYTYIDVVFQEPGHAFQVQFIKKHSDLKKAPSRHQVGTKFKLSADQINILEKCKNPTPIVELMKIVNRTDRTKFKKNILNPLLEQGLLEMTEPGRPRSPKQKYYITEKKQKLTCF
ncbi:MAG: hypothetical protein J7K32_04315 [Deltaproteobacteria bacterium]|nr:hypothetical protein [Deltaproteobacteria bacterium]